MSGLNINEQQKIASREDTGTVVHIEGVDELPLMYKNKDGKEVPVTITVSGTNSRQFREIENRHRKRRIKIKDLTGARMTEDGIEKVAHCTLAWQGVLADDKEEVRCDYENARVLYREVPHVYQQLMEAMGDSERFFGKSLTK